MLLVLAGLPEPQVNLTVRDERGEVVRKYDLSYPEVKVAVEFNGKVHVSSPGRGRRTSSDVRRSTTRGGACCPSSAPASTAPPSRPSGASTVSCSPAACRAYLCAWATSGALTSRATPTQHEHVRRMWPSERRSKGLNRRTWLCGRSSAYVAARGER